MPASIVAACAPWIAMNIQNTTMQITVIRIKLPIVLPLMSLSLVASTSPDRPRARGCRRASMPAGVRPLPIIHWRSRFLVASPTVRDLLLCAKHLFVEATQARSCWLWPSVRLKRRNHDRSRENHMVFKALSLSRCVLAGQRCAAATSVNARRWSPPHQQHATS